MQDPICTMLITKRINKAIGVLVRADLWGVGEGNI